MSRTALKALSLGLAVVACLLAAPAGADQITIDMVTVGDPGNANDTGGTNNGAVNYSYQIGKYDVTIGQYTAFLNAADPNGTNPNDIYNLSMGFIPNIAGISYTSGASAGAKYAVINNGGDNCGNCNGGRASGIAMPDWGLAINGSTQHPFKNNKMQ